MIDLAVITGEKAHNVIAFQQLFQSLEGINSYIQHLDDFAASPQPVRNRYDAVLFFFMPQEEPIDQDQPKYRGAPRAALEQLGQTDQGLIILHHALLAYPQWATWNAIVGMEDRHLSHYRHDETIHIKVADHSHPITQGLADWNMVDETYAMANANSNNQILLQTSHNESMRTLAWARHYKNSRTFCLQSGHDQQAWENRHFKTILKRGIAWTSRKHNGS